jgi:AcrR family transcriptional regulator
MPPKIDAEVRRRELVAAATELIADGGIDALTHRRLAAHIGSSVTVVTHYFADKRDLVLHTYNTVADDARGRVDAAANDPHDPLRALLCAHMPITDETEREWKVWLAFQGLAVGDPELMSAWEQRTESAAARIGRLVRAEQARGTIAAERDPDVEGRRLLSMVHGMAFLRIVAPDHWSRASVTDFVDVEVARLRDSQAGTGAVRVPAPR